MALLVGTRGTRKGRGTPSRGDGRVGERTSHFPPLSHHPLATHESVCLPTSTSKPAPPCGSCSLMCFLPPPTSRDWYPDRFPDLFL